MSSTPSIAFARKGRCSGRTGAKPTPQLPITAVVTPCQHDEPSCSSHIAHCADQPATDRDVGHHRGTSGAVYNLAATNDEIMHTAHASGRWGPVRPAESSARSESLGLHYAERMVTSVVVSADEHVVES